MLAAPASRHHHTSATLRLRRVVGDRGAGILIARLNLCLGRRARPAAPEQRLLRGRRGSRRPAARLRTARQPAGHRAVNSGGSIRARGPWSGPLGQTIPRTPIHFALDSQAICGGYLYRRPPSPTPPFTFPPAPPPSLLTYHVHPLPLRYLLCLLCLRPPLTLSLSFHPRGQPCWARL